MSFKNAYRVYTQPYTLKPRCNEVPNDWENVSVIAGVHYSQGSFATFYCKELWPD